MESDDTVSEDAKVNAAGGRQLSFSSPDLVWFLTDVFGESCSAK